jgi:beta-1,4-mannosyl-glycoprotein beta-1,4-N-acetylglucosaminyltransferase
VIWDTFMVNQELDMLECRLYELESIPNLIHVAVEADVDHQDHPKPYHLSENLGRFEQWKDRLVVVRATGLPTFADDPDPWAREHAQREFCPQGMADAAFDDVVLHGDIDEIPTVVVTRNIGLRGFVSFTQRGHFWSLRWEYPQPWFGTVAGRARDVRSFGAMRDTRNVARKIPNAGWHLSWLGGADAALTKVGSFCHPEVRDRIVDGLEADRFLRDGVHVDGQVMARCEIDSTFPRWIRDGHCPESWLV